ncbi:cytochrome b [Methylobacterium nonmethylotrophicum]|uniref:Cytochrome b n=1 Tax=Methylobacterium nonmethylotrophicum TaxID=1141884 RepID=A0A4Z0NXN8_9HYPH|nr:cytochrome b/b6 domain-containing protein [Methylobacterium nonmethylotrophicum]TGE02244.1 cytochrome b [Methylobacterium nonmethylotrophicum]
MTPRRYAPSQKVLHWIIAILIFALVPIALAMANLPDGGLKNALYEWHKSFGLTVLALALARLLVRASRGAPPLVDGLPAWQRRAARTSHLALYALIVLVPILGWAGTSACCAPVMLYFTLPLTLPISGGMPVGEAILKVHQVAAFTLVALVALHVAAALHHHLVRRDGTLRRMLPGGGEG